MLNEVKKTDLFCEYYARWITVYKQGAIRKVTMDKYLMTHQWVEKLVPNLQISEMTRISIAVSTSSYTKGGLLDER